jgi:hypothetical protein
MLLPFVLVQTLYWLALATWFGSLLFVIVAAPIIFRVVRDSHPTLPGVLSVNLDDQHGTLLAGSIVSGLLTTVHRLQAICAGALLPLVIAQWLLTRPHDTALVIGILRSALHVGAAAMFLYDWRVVWPKVEAARQKYLDNADAPDIANPALDEFDRRQLESAALKRNVLFALTGTILFSGWVSMAQTITFG